MPGYALLRLVTRPFVAFWMFCSLVIASAVGGAELVFSGTLRSLRETGSLDALRSFETGAFPTSPEHVRNTALVLAPAAFGLLFGQILRELQHTTFAWALPRAPARVARAFLGVTAVLTALASTVYRGQGGSLGPVIAGAIALFFFAAGTSIFNPHPSRLLPRATLAGVALAALSVDAWTEWCSRAPAAAVTLLVMGAGAYLWYALSKGTRRAKGLIRSVSIVNGADAQADEAFWTESRFRRNAPTRLYEKRRNDPTILAFVRAAHYENFGYVPFGWLRTVVTLGGVALLLTLLLCFHDGFEIEGSPARGLAFAYHAIARPDLPPPHEWNSPAYAIVASIIASFGAMHVVVHSFTLRADRVYPASRSDRARTAYWTALLQNLGFALLVGVMWAAAVEALARLAGYADRGGPLPGYARSLVLVVLSTPFIQWFHLRYYQTGIVKRWSTPVYVGVQIVLFGGVVVAHIVALKAWYRTGAHTGLAVQLIVLAVLLTLTQAALWRAVHRHFARHDLA